MTRTDPKPRAGATSAQPLAIVGIGCRLPGGVIDLDSYWDLLSQGRDGVREVPPERWDLRAHYSADPDAPGKMYVRRGGFLEQDIRSIDFEFFGISPREAERIDPQQRLLLEVCWEALEDAGIAPDRLAGSRTGVFVGAFTLDNLLAQMNPADRARIGAHSATGSTATILSNRLSYFLDLHGPSLSVDTACSSSLVALHLASRAIAAGDCEMALVGGVNVIFRPEYMIAMCKGQFLAADGRSKSFDARADGYGRGEGAGMVVVKPLERALADGDRIHAVIRATGCNQDGRSNGITVPNAAAQQALIDAVVAAAQVDARQIRYVEAHGTGTPVGDPLEASALGAALGRDRAGDERLVVGSVKANIGHLEAAAGIAGLIKLCAVCTHRAIPPIANLQQANPAIPFDRLGLRLATRLEPLPPATEPILCAINSFGYGGTNAHAVVESAPPLAPRADDTAPAAPIVLPVSARSGPALRELVLRFRGLLDDPPAPPAALAACAGSRRAHLPQRAAFVGRSRADLQQAIDDWLAGGGDAPRAAGGDAALRPVFVFSGMGPQWWAMGRQLFDAEPVYRATVERVDAIFQSLAGWSLLEEMGRDEISSRMRRTEIAQPANFAVQAGVLAVLRARGIEPAAVVGHSVGEVSSAYAAGVLGLEDAVRVSYHRSQVQARAAGQGAMLAVGLTEAEATSLIAPLGGRVCIAAVNAPKAVTLAGEADALHELAGRLEVKGVFNRLLQVEVAYHSQFMDPLRQPLIDALQGIAPQQPRCPMYSTVSGGRVEGVPCTPAYWADNVREPVRFMHAMNAMIADGHRVFLEVGPHPVLSGSMREILTRGRTPGQVVSTLARGQDEALLLAKSVAGLYEAGCAIDWARVQGRPTRFVPLPAYPWQRERMWHDERPDQGPAGETATAGMAGFRAPIPEVAWERTINEQYVPYLHDHVVQGMTLLPGAAFVDAALGIQREVGADAYPFCVEHAAFQSPLVFAAAEERVLRASYEPDSRRVSLYSRGADGGDWQRHAEMALARVSAARAADDLDLLRARYSQSVEIPELYARLADIGLQYGPQFQRIGWLAADGDVVLARLDLPQPADGYDIDHVIHPLLLDGAFQALLAALDVGGGTGYVPASIRRVSVHAPVPGRVWCHGRIEYRGSDHVLGSLTLFAEDGAVVAEVEGIRCAAVVSAASSPAAQVDKWISRLAWHAAPVEPAEQRLGAWLLLAEAGFAPGTDASAVADRLEQAGCERVLRVGVGAQPAGGQGALFWVDTADDWAALVQQYPPAGLAGIAYFAAATEDEPLAATVALTTRLWQLFRRLPASAPAPRVHFVSRNACAVVPGDRVHGFRAAAGIGFLRVAHNEFPALACTSIDHDGSAPAVGQVAAELLADRAEDAVALRGECRFSQRVDYVGALALERERLADHLAPRRTAAGVVLDRTRNSQAVGQRQDTLYWRTDGDGPGAPGAGQVTVEVAYFGLDGRAVSAGSSAYALSQEAMREFCGRVVLVGPDVQGVGVGDLVAGSGRCRIGSHIRVDADRLFALPGQGRPSPAAARIALTDAPVRLAIERRARARAGERALVFGAGGALAEAAVAALREAGLSVDVADTGAADGVIDLSRCEAGALLESAGGGEGIDVLVFCDRPGEPVEHRIPMSPRSRVVILASAPSRAHVAACLRLADGAREVHVVDLLELDVRDAGAHADLVSELARRDAATAVLGADQLVAGRLEGPAVEGWCALDMGGTTAAVPTPSIDADAVTTAVVTGGFGGFGFAVATHLVAKGTRRLVLTGRSGARSEEVRRTLAAWRAEGVTVVEAKLDVADPAAVDALFADLRAQGVADCSLFHAAGVLEDDAIAGLDAASFARVLAPKVGGAWNLHAALEGHGIHARHFVLFSSASAVIGNSRQANYVAANAFLDAFAAHRRACGLAATSINWGALAEVGMAASDPDVQRHLENIGMALMPLRTALHGLTTAMREAPVHIAIMDVDWPRWGRSEPHGARSLRFAHLTGKGAAEGDDSLRDILQSLPEADRLDLVGEMLVAQLAEVLRMPAERIDGSRRLNDLGFDSLMAVDLQVGLEMSFGVEFSTLELMRGQSIAEFAAAVLARLGIAGAGDDATAPEVDVDALSEAELDRLLAESAA